METYIIVALLVAVASLLGVLYWREITRPEPCDAPEEVVVKLSPMKGKRYFWAAYDSEGHMLAASSVRGVASREVAIERASRALKGSITWEGV